MADLLDPLRSLSEQAAHAVPAAEVRRRGETLRRRRVATRSLGATAAVAMLVTGGALAFDQPPAPGPRPAPPATSGPEPTPDPGPPVEEPAEPLLRVPDGFALDLGLPQRSEPGEPGRQGPGRGVRVSGLELCTRTFTAPEAGDRLAVTFGDVEYGVQRELLVYPDAATAAQVQQEVADLAAGCSVQGAGGVTSPRSYRLVGSAPGDAATSILLTYVENDLPLLGEGRLAAIRVGNAVLLATEFGEGPGETDLPRAREGQQRWLEEQIGPLVARMCVFSADPGACP